MTLDKEGKQPLVVSPGQDMLFLGPPGAFLRVIPSEPPAGALMPTEVKIEDLKEGKLQHYTFKRKGLLYMGYYYPHKYTGAPLEPEADSKIYLYFFKPEFFLDSNTIREETNTSSNNIDNQEVIPYKEDIKIEPLEKSNIAHIMGWISIIIFFILLFVCTRQVRKYYFFNINDPGPASSMRSLFESGTREFLCIYCGKQLKIKGRFECRLGHVPDQEQYIFEKCGVRIDGKQCPDIFDYMRCNNCGEEIALNEHNYNREEIENRGKDYILRTNPHKITEAYVVGISGVASLAASSVVAVLFAVPWAKENSLAIDMYIFIYGFWEFYKNFAPIGFYIGFVAVAGLIIFLYKRFKIEDIIVENPYVKRGI
ncbi:MAG TPA: hypothetical protein VMW42_01495 [Desulfatiglandales bacterium]|nr:hypothetical protein [Desulfatiglandales bacterium]